MARVERRNTPHRPQRRVDVVFRPEVFTAAVAGGCVVDIGAATSTRATIVIVDVAITGGSTTGAAATSTVEGGGTIAVVDGAAIT